MASVISYVDTSELQTSNFILLSMFNVILRHIPDHFNILASDYTIHKIQLDIDIRNNTVKQSTHIQKQLRKWFPCNPTIIAIVEAPTLFMLALCPP